MSMPVSRILGRFGGLGPPCAQKDKNEGGGGNGRANVVNVGG